MADRGSSGLTKAAKKNLKRKLARHRAAALRAATTKPNEDEVVTPEELKEILTREMEVAKEQKDNEAVNSLREQLWVINDMIAGVRTDLPDEDLKRILEKLPISHALKQKAMPGSEPNSEPSAKPSGNKTPKSEVPKENGVESSSSKSEDIQIKEKKLRGLKKKLREVRKLKEKIANGDKMEKNQLEKAKLEATLVDQIDELELDIREARLDS